MSSHGAVRRSGRAVLASTLAFCAGVIGSVEARADDVPPSPSVALPAPLAPRVAKATPPREWKWGGVLDVSNASSFLLFAGGALSSLALHEMGHVVTNLVQGNVPALSGVLYGKFIPWFVIDPRIRKVNGVYYEHNGSVFHDGAMGYYAIGMAGFYVQNLSSEIILSTKPGLIYERSPVLKGMLLMNVALSVGYATASLIGTENSNGDIYGASHNSDYPHQFLAAMVMSNGVFDALRYFFPDNTSIPWVSRSTKTMMIGMNFASK